MTSDRASPELKPSGRPPISNPRTPGWEVGEEPGWTNILSRQSGNNRVHCRNGTEKENVTIYLKLLSSCY